MGVGNDKELKFQAKEHRGEKEVKAMDEENYHLSSSFLNGCKGRDIGFINAREKVVEAMEAQRQFHDNQRKNTH